MAKFALVAVLTVMEALRRLWQRVTGRVPVPVRVPAGTVNKIFAGERGLGGNSFSHLWLEWSAESVMGAWRRYRR